MAKFDVKDSGNHQYYPSGMRRDVDESKTMYDLVFDGPLIERFATHLTKGAAKYEPKNWMKANSFEEMDRFRLSAVRHFIQWLRGDVDEDHFAATVFNMNGHEYVKDKLNE